MIEVRRDLYMNVQSGEEKNNKFYEIKSILENIIKKIEE